MYEMREINNREQNKLAQCYRSYRCYFAILLVSTFVSIILLSVFINMHTQSLYTEIALKETKNISTTVTANESDNQITKKPKHSTTTSSTTGTTTSHTLSTIISTTIALTAIASTTITSTTITPTKMDEENITETTTNRTRYINKESQNNILNDTSSTTSSLANDAGNTKYIHSPNTTTISTSRPTPNITTASTTENETLSTSQTISRTVTAESTISPSTSQAEYSEQYEEHTEKITVTTLSTNETTLSSLQKTTASTVERASMNEINESSSKTPNNESHFVEKINSSSTVHKDAEITTMITEQSSKGDVESTTWSNISIDINNAGNIDDRNFTDMNKKSQHNILNDTSSTTSSLPNDAGNTKYIHSQFEKYTANSIFGTTETTTTLISSNHSTTMIVPTSYDTNLPSTTIFPNKTTNDICNTSYCRQIASKMLSYMNVSANPCNDFYGYACGGFETNPLMMDMDQAQKFSNYERIKKQMMKEKQENVSLTFMTYYNSCVKYERTVSFRERIKMARDALDKVGKFYVKDTCSADSANFTDLFAKLILHHSAFLFDVVPEVDEYHSNNFTLKIGPTSYKSPFKAEYVEDLCSENDFKTDIYHMNFKAMYIQYNRYKTCKKQDEKDEIRKSVSDALIILKVFGDLNDNNLELKRINETINVINSVIMQEYFSHVSNKSYSREIYPENDYKRISLKDLENNNAFINWTHLIESLTKTNEIIDKDIQVYFLKPMDKGLQKLKEFAERNCTDFHNAIMALYAHKLYQELVLPRQNTKNHCLHVATYLLRPEATNLYISSFADHEIERMNNRTTDMFNELKQTLKWKIENAKWVTEKEKKKKLLNKIDSLELALPAVSYFKNKDLLYNDYNLSQNTLSENYFDNSINLMKRYRTLMYTEIRRKFNISVQLWTYYATPFQSEINMIYSLNQIVIPYGIIDWTINNEDSLNYISLATLGNIIALQIAHHFDEIDIYYWNQTRNTESLILQNVTIPQLAMNKQFSRMTGLKLTYDTLDRMRSKVQEKNLPWMNFHIDNLFYLAYTQMYCMKTPLTSSSYVALYESEDLPNHILVRMFKNPLIDVAWKCPMDQCDPKDTCSEFSNIHVKKSAKPE